MFSTLPSVLGLVALATPSIAGYTLQDDYSGANFFSGFTFWDTPDPTHGCVDYKSQADAASLISAGASTYMGVDNSTQLSPGQGRGSVRITSTKAYNQGLFIIDATHMPVGCGVWPAFWLVGPKWPDDGEIDIIEGVNNQKSNSMTLHTGTACTMQQQDNMSGKFGISTNCQSSSANNQGCGIDAQSDNSYGTGFNNAQGGVYATEWTTDAINIWFFTRSAIPADIASGSPSPASWGMPTAVFKGNCDISSSFKDLSIVFDTTFCGDWAGNTFSEMCGSTVGTGTSCQNYVEQNPADFDEAYWNVNYVKVYSGSDDGVAGGSPYAPTSTVGTSLPSSTPLLHISAGLGINLPPLIPAATSTDASSTATLAALSTISTTPTAISFGGPYNIFGGGDGAKEVAQSAAAPSAAASSAAASSAAAPSAPAPSAPAAPAPAAPTQTIEAAVVGANGIVGEALEPPQLRRRNSGPEMRRHLAAHKHSNYHAAKQH